MHILEIAENALDAGASLIEIKIHDDPGANRLFVTPTNILAPSTTYTTTFTTTVADFAGQALTTASTFNFTTGAAEQEEPEIVDGRCDDFSCVIWFNEPMNHDAQSGDDYENSVLNPSN